MKYIEKGATPASFAKWKQAQQSLLEWQTPPSDNLKKHLLEEQGYICCYCGQRIHHDHNTSIEHLFPKGEPTYKSRMYDYNNLMASCNGHHRAIIHVVEAGETYQDIEEKYNTLLEILIEENPRQNLFDLKKNQKLNIRQASTQNLHCDKKKANSLIPIHPLMPSCETHFGYDFDGIIFAVGQRSELSKCRQNN